MDLEVRWIARVELMRVGWDFGAVFNGEDEGGWNY